MSVLLGLIAGYLAAALGLVHFDPISRAAWFSAVVPFDFGLALGELCERKVDTDALVRGLGTVRGGIFNTFPHTSFAQNIGLVGMTGAKSRWAVACSGVILVLFGLFPKMGAPIASIPPAEPGGAGLGMFGMVAATGIKILQRVDFGPRANLLIVAASLSFGMLPMVAPEFFHSLPAWSGALTHSGITLAAMSAVLLNAFFRRAPAGAAHGSGRTAPTRGRGDNPERSPACRRR